MDINEKIRAIAEGEFEVQAKLKVDEITDICRRLRSAESERDYSKQQLSVLRKEYLSSFRRSSEIINSINLEIDFLKTQKPAITLHAVAGECKIEWHGDWSLIEGSADFYLHPLDPTACKFNK
jgi:hypothetical protein